MNTEQAVQPAVWMGNPTLPERRADIRTMPDDEWKQYREGIKRILNNAGESDETRRLALEMLFEADRRLWVNGLANRKYWNDSMTQDATI